jgi:aryl-alcohol dehydrogenase-like predicted oxidoreductase
MHRRTVGDALNLPVIGMGCLGLAGGYGPIDPALAVRTVQCALDGGVTHFDIADYHAAGAGERLLGRALAGRRDEAVVATKTGIVHRDNGPPGLDGSPEHIDRACRASLHRLGLDHLDLYYLARLDPRVPVAESVGALADLVRAGLVRHIGLCEVSAATLRMAVAVAPVAAVQVEYSLLARDPELGLLGAAAELGVGVVAYRPLVCGLLAGSPSVHVHFSEAAGSDWRRRDPRFAPGNRPANVARFRELARFAARYGTTPARAALAWVLSAGDDVVAIPGLRSPDQVRDVAGAADLDLTADAWDELGEAFPPGCAAGDRYPPPMLQLIEESR